MDIRTKSIKSLTAREYAACSRANYGFSDGYMRPVLARKRLTQSDNMVIMIWTDDGKQMIGWALTTPIQRRMKTDADYRDPDLFHYLEVSDYVRKRSKLTCMFWVNARYRKKGYGKVLMKEVLKHDPRPHVMPHDEASGELFSSFEVSVLRHDKGWMRKKPLSA